MDAIQHSLLGLGNFSLYFAVALVLLLAFKFIYVLVTPHDEWKLVKDEQNTAAATGFVGAVIGFSIALGGSDFLFFLSVLDHGERYRRCARTNKRRRS